LKTPLGLWTSHGHFDTQDSPWPELGGSHHIVFFVPRGRDYIQMALFLGTPKLDEIVPVGVLGLWELITPDCKVWSQRGLNQSCSFPWELSNAVLHSRIRCQEEVDSWLLVVGSQIAILTPGPSFAHNLGCRCPNDQCEAILDIYASRPLQCHKEHFNARCFEPCCRTLKIQESRRTSFPTFGSVTCIFTLSPKMGLRHHLWKMYVLV
jgi:hypothetical protein